MKITIKPNSPRYSQEFQVIPINTFVGDKELIEIVRTKLNFKSLHDHWALTGGSALTFLIDHLKLSYPTNIQQDLDIIVENPKYITWLLSDEVKKEEPKPDNIFARVTNSMPANYIGVIKLQINNHPKFTELQLINENPGGAILTPVLTTLSKYRTTYQSFTFERLETYKNKQEYSISLGNNFVYQTPFVTELCKYLASFDITLPQVALLFKGTSPVAFVVASQAIFGLATNQLSLTTEQSDMYDLYFDVPHKWEGPKAKLYKHLQIVTNRISKYQTRYNLELDSNVQRIITKFTTGD